MGATKEMYMEIVQVEMERQRFEQLCTSNGLENEKDFKLKKVSVPDYPYEKHERWIKQKKIADTEYRKLKNIEYELRNE